MEIDREGFPLNDYYSRIHRSYDRINHIFTFGGDRVWRKKAARLCLEPGPLRIADICTGTGDFILELAGRVGDGVTLTAFDFNSAMLEEAKRKHHERSGGGGIAPVNFVEGDVATMPFADRTFDAIGITFGIRNLLYKNPKAGRHLLELRRVLVNGGHLVLLESSRPACAVWRLFNNIFLRLILPILGGMISGHMDAYRYLAVSSRNYYSAVEMRSILEASGFSVRSVKALFLGSVMLVDAQKNEEDYVS